MRRALHELEPRLEALLPKPEHEWDRNQKACQREDVRDPADSVFILLGHKEEKECADERREENDRENVVLHIFKSSAAVPGLSGGRHDCRCEGETPSPQA